MKLSYPEYDNDCTFSIENSIKDTLMVNLREKVTIVDKHKGLNWEYISTDKEVKSYCEIMKYSIAPIKGIYNVRDLQFFLEEVQQVIDMKTGFSPEKIVDFTEDTKKGKLNFGQLIYLDTIAEVTKEKKESSEIRFTSNRIPNSCYAYMKVVYTNQYHNIKTNPINVGVTIDFYPSEEITKQQSFLQFISMRRLNKLNPEYKHFYNIFSWFNG